METINLYGASGHAKVVMDIIRSCGNEVGILYDDNPPAEELHGVPISLPISVSGPLIISIGNSSIRKSIVEKHSGLNFASAIHPYSHISPQAKIGEGTVVMGGAIIESDAEIGRHCIINTASAVNHDCRIGDYVHIAPNANICGAVEVGEGTWIGAGATVVQGIRIGSWCTIGAGAVVIHDVPDGATVVGNPARIIKQ